MKLLMVENSQFVVRPCGVCRNVWRKDQPSDAGVMWLSGLNSFSAYSVADSSEVRMPKRSPSCRTAFRMKNQPPIRNAMRKMNSAFWKISFAGFFVFAIKMKNSKILQSSQE